jgi:hypothetical protein
MSCHPCLTLADCHVTSCLPAAYHPPVPAPLLILVANAPLSWLLFHIVISSSVRDLLRPFPHPPPAADGWLVGERHRQILSGRRSSSSLSSLTGLHPPPPPQTPLLSSSSASWLQGEGWPPGVGDNATTRCCSILGIHCRHCSAHAPVEPALFVMLRPRRSACIAPPPPAPRASLVSPNRRTLQQARQAQQH